MTWLQCLAWGLFGGFAVEGLEFSSAIKRCQGWPWRQPGEVKLAPFATSVLVRLVIGGGIAAALGRSGAVGSPAIAVAIGVATPLLVEKFLPALVPSLGGK